MAVNARTPIHKLQTNIPLVGTVRGAWFSPTKTEGYSDQLKLRVQTAEGTVDTYVSDRCINDAVAAGVIIDTGNDAEGHPTFKVATSKPVTICKREQGTKKVTTFEVEGGKPETTKPVTVAQVVKQAGPGMPKDQKAEVQTAKVDAFTSLVADYRACLRAAENNLTEDSGYTGSDIVAAAATLFIQMQRENIHAPVAPLDLSEFESVPTALVEDDRDPF